MADEKVTAVKAEVQRLLDANVIRAVKYPTWLANTLPVKKKNGKWPMCIDFTNLNKACPKDDFPLPRIDRVVDDAVKRPLIREDLKVIQYQSQEADKTFITSDGTSPYNSTRKWAVKRHYHEDNN